MAYFSQFPYSYTLMLSYLKKLERIHVNTLTHQIIIIKMYSDTVQQLQHVLKLIYFFCTHLNFLPNFWPVVLSVKIK